MVKQLQFRSEVTMDVMETVDGQRLIAMYVELQGDAKSARTKRWAKFQSTIDMDADGNVIGIELLPTKYVKFPGIERGINHVE